MSLCEREGGTRCCISRPACAQTDIRGLKAGDERVYPRRQFGCSLSALHVAAVCIAAVRTAAAATIIQFVPLSFWVEKLKEAHAVKFRAIPAGAETSELDCRHAVVALLANSHLVNKR